MLRSSQLCMFKQVSVWALRLGRPCLPSESLTLHLSRMQLVALSCRAVFVQRHAWSVAAQEELDMADKRHGPCGSRKVSVSSLAERVTKKRTAQEGNVCVASWAAIGSTRQSVLSSSAEYNILAYDGGTELPS